LTIWCDSDALPSLARRTMSRIRSSSKSVLSGRYLCIRYRIPNIKLDAIRYLPRLASRRSRRSRFKFGLLWDDPGWFGSWQLGESCAQLLRMQPRAEALKVDSGTEAPGGLCEGYLTPFVGCTDEAKAGPCQRAAYVRVSLSRASRSPAQFCGEMLLAATLLLRSPFLHPSFRLRKLDDDAKYCSELEEVIYSRARGSTRACAWGSA